MLEAKRNPGSKDTMKALEAYQSAAGEFQGALEDSVRVLPTIVYGLEQTAKELKKLGGGSGPVDTNVYEIEFGTKRNAITTPRNCFCRRHSRHRPLKHWEQAHRQRQAH